MEGYKIKVNISLGANCDSDKNCVKLGDYLYSQKVLFMNIKIFLRCPETECLSTIRVEITLSVLKDPNCFTLSVILKVMQGAVRTLSLLAAITIKISLHRLGIIYLSLSSSTRPRHSRPGASCYLYSFSSQSPWCGRGSDNFSTTRVKVLHEIS